MTRLAFPLSFDDIAALACCVLAGKVVAVGAHHRHHHLWEAGLRAGC